ncbi:hypothetical protein HY091_01800 [Candidatus Kaiserbacteria bacterium]|nr:hypothetical protein [Candidatus Kaiserbacteria bacterium]
MKKIIFAAGFILSFTAFAPAAFAEGDIGQADWPCFDAIDPTQPTTCDTANGYHFVPLAPIPGLTADQNGTPFIGTPDLPSFLNNLYQYLIGFAAALAVIYVIWGGLEISTQDSVSKQSDGRKRIEGALFGLALVLAPYLVFYVINPAIVNLSLNLPALQTQGGTFGTGVNSPTQSTTAANGVTTTVTGTYLQTAHFASNDQTNNNNARDAWVSSCNSSGGVGYAAQDSGCGSNVVPAGGKTTCVSTSDAIAKCATFSKSAYNFVNIGAACSGVISCFASIDLQPLNTDASAVSGFVGACSSDGGYACIAAGTGLSIPHGLGLRELSACPEAITGLAGNASGKCYQAGLFCARTQGASQCAANTTLH